MHRHHVTVPRARSFLLSPSLCLRDTTSGRDCLLVFALLMIAPSTSPQMPSGSHRAFDNYDIMWQILWYLSPSTLVEDGELCINGDKTMLARCSRTSRGMSRPALDLLWRNLPSLSPLLSLLESRSTRSAKDFRIEKPRTKKSRSVVNVYSVLVGIYTPVH